ncbi:hypothetical protein [Deinococcus sp. PEB2-63]
MTRYQATRKASPELREYMKRRYYVPFPLTDDEAADFALYLGAQGVQVTWSKRHPGAFSSDGVDMCPHAWPWRVGRGELRARAQAQAGASSEGGEAQ